jgi:hypothetical protein
MPARRSSLLGKWRVTEMELWDTDFVDMLEPAYINFEAKCLTGNMPSNFNVFLSKRPHSSARFSNQSR